MAPLFPAGALVMLVLVVAIGILMMYFQRIRTRLAESEARFRMLFEKAPLGYQSLDAEGRIIDVNQMWLDTLGYSRDEVLGHWFGEFMAAEWAERVRRIFHRFRESGEIRGVEIEMVSKDGSRFMASFDGRIGYDEQGRFQQMHCIFTDITERKLAEQALQESERKYRELTDLLPQTVFECDGEGNLTFGNLKGLEIFGYSREDLDRGMNIFRLIVPADRDRAAENFLKAINGERRGEGEYSALRKDGTTFPVIIYSSPVIDDGRFLGLRGIVVDVTERKRMEETLKRSEEQYRLLFENNPHPMWVYDLDTLSFLAVNDAAVGHYGHSKEEFLGMTVKDIRPPEDIPVLLENVAGVVEGIGRAGVWRHLKKDGTLIHVEITSHALNFGGRRAELVLANDVTDRKRLEEQLLHSQKMEAVGQLAGGVAHDFNNIVTAIIGYASLLQIKMQEEDPLRVNVERILALSDRAAHLTQSLLVFSRKQIINPKPVDLNEIVGRVGKLLSRVIGEDIDFVSTLIDHPLVVLADSSQIEQVLMNLCTNARDAMIEGGRLTMKTDLLHLDRPFHKLRGECSFGQYAVVSVTDTGDGMDEATKARVFEPFFTTKEVGKGTGLGLSISYGIVTQHGGFMEVRSEPGKGTTFDVYFPLIRAVGGDTETPRHVVSEGGTETILIAEDDGEMREAAAFVLREFGYRTIEAVNGEDAVRLFMENRDAVQLLILDVVMPKKSGKAVYEEARKVRPDIEALFMSGYTENVIQKKGICEEGTHFVSKPISPTELLKKVRALLEGGRGEPA